MLLEPQDAALFFKLHQALLLFFNQRLKVVADDIADPDELSSLSPEVRFKVRDAFLKHTDLIQAFVDETPPAFPTPNSTSLAPGGTWFTASSTSFGN